VLEPLSRSCVTAGIALVSAAIVTVAPATVSPMASAVSPGVALTTSYGDLSANTMDNIEYISANMLGLGTADLGNIDLDGVIEQVRLGTLTMGGLLSGLGFSDEGLGDLLKLATNVSTLGDLLDFLGLGDLGLSRYSLTALLGDLGPATDFYRNLDLDLELGNFRFADVLSAFGINAEIPLGLGQLLVGLGDGNLAGEHLGSLLSDVGLLTQVLGWLNATAADLLDPIPLVGPLLTDLVSGLLGADGLEGLLNNFTVGDLLGDLRIDETVSSLLGTVGGALLSLGNVTIGGILEDFGFADSIGDLTLRDVLGGLGGALGGVLTDGPLGLDLTWLLNGLDLGDLVGFLGLDDLSLNLGDLVGDWVNPYLADLLEGFVQG